MPLKLAVILGSAHQNWIGLRVARFAVGLLQKRVHGATLVDPVEFALPFWDKWYAHALQFASSQGKPY